MNVTILMNKMLELISVSLKLFNSHLLYVQKI